MSYFYLALDCHYVLKQVLKVNKAAVAVTGGSWWLLASREGTHRIRGGNLIRNSSVSRHKGAINPPAALMISRSPAPLFLCSSIRLFVRNLLSLSLSSPNAAQSAARPVI